jgi:hypothetical protein
MLNSKPDAQSLFGSAPSRFYVITFCTPVDPTSFSSCRRPVGPSIRPARPRQQQRLLGSALEERDEVVALLGLLHAGEGHLGAGYVLFRVLEVVELQLPSVVGQCTAPVSINARSTYQSVLAPGDALGLVCIRVGKARHLARLAAEEAVQLGSDLVALASSQRMALRASRLLAWLHPIMS